MESKIFEKLLKVQKNLVCNKTQFNKFGGYAYRSCEDILEASKPLFADVGMILLLRDEIEEKGGRVYVRATATAIDVESGEEVSAMAYAREEETKKGMDAAQITGSASSYARKYALNGLLMIDDCKDADTMDNRSENNTGRTAEIEKIAREKGITMPQVTEWICIKFGQGLSIDTISESQFNELRNALKK